MLPMNLQQQLPTTPEERRLIDQIDTEVGRLGKQQSGFNSPDYFRRGELIGHLAAALAAVTAALRVG